jgi:hypothetical protein
VTGSNVDGRPFAVHVIDGKRKLDPMSSLFAALLATAFAGTPAGDDLFVRDLRTIDGVVSAIHLRAESDQRARLVFCLDDDLFEKSRWFDAIEKEFKGRPFDVVITGRSEPARRLTKADLVPAPQKGGAQSSSSADSWSPRTGRTPVSEWSQGILPFARRGAAVVFISSGSPADSWAAPKSDRDFDDCLDPAWHEEEVGARFAAAGVPLWIVAPEAPFSCDSAVTLCRFLPLTNRPVYAAGRQFMGRTYAPPRFEAGEELTPEAIAERMKRRVPFPRFEGHLSTMIKLDVELDSRAETDVPSGTGFWSYARACHLSRGRYFVFAGGHDEFLDRCERGPALDGVDAPLDRPAKAQWDAIGTTAPVKTLRTILSGALSAMRELFEVVEPRHRSGGFIGSRLLAPIDAFESPGTHRTTLILSVEGVRDCAGWKEFSKKLAAPVAAQDRAWLRWSSSLDLDAARWDSVGARARNDALLERFWLKMSAFHLESLRVLTADPEHFLIHPKDHWRYAVASVEAIRMSDCLEAYDGRRIPPEVEAASSRFRRSLRDKATQIEQGNLLIVTSNPQVFEPGYVPTRGEFVSTGGPFDPNYRAQREPLQPIANLDPSLQTRALDLIETGREIHDSLHGTPWDWVVYYSSIDVFVFLVEMAPPDDSIKPRPSKKPDDDGPATPTGPAPGSTPGTKPGSTGGGG